MANHGRVRPRATRLAAAAKGFGKPPSLEKALVAVSTGAPHFDCGGYENVAWRRAQICESRIAPDGSLCCVSGLQVDARNSPPTIVAVGKELALINLAAPLLALTSASGERVKVSPD